LLYKNDHQGYINLIVDEMLPRIEQEKLADYVDVFCEQDFFSPEETIQICQAAKQYGLKAKLHANQLHCSGGVQAGVVVNALSVDHLESMDDNAIAVLSGSDTIGTMLPTAAFFLRMQYPPARKLIASGAAVALASDYNPGSSPSGNMNLVVAMGCIQMKMLPEEAINAATLNGAFAMELQNEVGSIRRGKRANLIVTTPVNSIAYLPYSFGENWIDQVMINGEFI
jgi:imidazolonepropionase